MRTNIPIQYQGPDATLPVTTDLYVPDVPKRDSNSPN